MSRIFRRRLLLGVLLPAVGCGLFALDHVLGRPDRMAAAESKAELLAVRDQLLRYEAEHARLPAALEELPGDYLRPDQIAGADGARYIYQPDKRRLAEARGPAIRGLITYRMTPREVDLPGVDPPQPTARPGAGNPVAEAPANVPVTRQTVMPVATPQPVESPVAPVTSPTPSVPATPIAPPEPQAPAVAARAGGLNAALIVPKGPELKAPPAGALVYEAEHYTEMNYGWEVHQDPECSGGAFLHCKEGIANGPGQTRYQLGNFYDVRATRDVTSLRYHLKIPATGTYYVYGRMWTTDTHCSNYVCVQFDGGGPYGGGMGNTTPFRWVWSPMKDNPVHLTAGDHFLHAFIHEDGVKVDQYIVSPTPVTGGTPYAANFLPAQGTAWQKADGPPVHLAFDYQSMVITPKLKPDFRLVLRRLRPSAEKATLQVRLEGAAGGRDLKVADGELALESLPELSLLPLDFSALDLQKMPRREYVLRGRLLAPDGKVLAECRVPVGRPYAWEVYSGKFLSNEQPGPLDGDLERTLKPGEARGWAPFADGSWDHFGVLDFGVQQGNNSLHAPQFCAIYARTGIKVARADTYLFKLQADDQMILWLDGKEIFRHNENLPVTRAATWLEVKLEQGEHRLRMRVNQMQGRWQACLKIRTKDDDPSDVEGLP